MQFNNGEVVLPNPLQFTLFNSNEKAQLQYPRLFGSGGGGSVFAFTPIDSNHKDNTGDLSKEKEEIVVKVSWLKSTASIERECRVLQELEKNNVKGRV